MILNWPHMCLMFFSDCGFRFPVAPFPSGDCLTSDL